MNTTLPTVTLVQDPDKCEHDLLAKGLPEVKIGEHGFVRMVDLSPRLVPEGRTADFAVVRAARTSTGQGLKSPAEDLKLLRHLFRERHTTPFEMVEFTWMMQLPIFVARQLIRHRTASVNEFSARYAEVPDKFWVPDAVRLQSTHNKQGGESVAAPDVHDDFCTSLDEVQVKAYQAYDAALKKGISREIARTTLPVSLFTRWYWKCDLHNCMHMLGLRMDGHAQKEIRDYADAMYACMQPVVPISLQAFDDYHPLRGGMQLSSLEINVISGRCTMAESRMSDREKIEFLKKLQRLGLPASAGV